MKSFRTVLISISAIVIVISLFIVQDSPEQSKQSGKQFKKREQFEAQRRQEFLMLRDPKTNMIPKNIYTLEKEFADQLPKVSSTVFANGRMQKNTSALTWIERGPNNTSGRIRGMGIDIRTTGTPTIIAGAISGGLWKSTDGGDSWSKKTSFAQLHSVTCVTQDTRTGHQDTWYAGSGENVGNSASAEGAAYLGDGIFKSTDNGETWNLLASTQSANNNVFSSDWQYVWRIVVHPVSGNVYAATTGGIYRSTDGGTSWTHAIPANTNDPVKTDITVALDGALYVAASSNGDGNTIKGIRKSTDDGATWVEASPTMPDEFGRPVIATAPSNADILYVLYEGISGANNTPNVHNHMLWRSDDKAATWTNISTVIPANTAPALDTFNTQGGYDMLLTVKPDNPNFIIFGGVSLFKIPDVTNDNLTLAQKHIGGYGIAANNTANALNDYINHHPDQHLGIFKPGSNVIFYCANDGGVNLANDITAESGPSFWQKPKRAGLNITQMYSVSLDKSESGSGYIAAGLQDRGNWMSRTNGATVNWQEVSGGDGSYAEIAPNGVNVFQSTSQGNLFRFTKSDSSSPAGSSVSMTPENLANALFNNPFAIDPTNSDILYFAGGDKTIPTSTGIWRTGNASAETPLWTYFTNSNTADEQVSAVAVSTTSAANVLYYATSGGKVFRIDNAATADAATTLPISITGANFPAGYVNCIAIDPSNSSNVLVVFSNYGVDKLWYSTDAGGSWSSVTGNMTGTNAPSARYAEVFSIGGVQHVFLATSTGVYFTTNLTGANTIWTQEATKAIGNVVSVMMDYRASDQTLIVGTHGRGAFETKISAALAVAKNGTVPEAFELSQNFPNPFNPTTTIKFVIAERGNVSLKIFDIQGKEVATIINGMKEAGNYEFQFDGTRLASGIYLYTLTSNGVTQTRKMTLLK